MARGDGRAVPAIARGFSLIELMVAVVLGLLLSAGIVTLFAATSKTNRAQDALARLQENGRYAVTRIADDLRMLGGQYCSNVTNEGWTPSVNGDLLPTLSLMANAIGWTFPDSGDKAGTPPAGWPGGIVYPLSPSAFVQGYKCAKSGACTPGVPGPANGLPTAGASADHRVRGADVLTLRYQRGTGWPYMATGSGTTAEITLTPDWLDANNCGKGPDDCLNFANGDLALLTDCGGGQVFTTTVAGKLLKPAGLLEPDKLRPVTNNSGFDSRIFNFSRDFTTVSYYLALKDDSNPDQAGRLIPALYRKVNGGPADEIVQGVERLDFLYGVQYADGSLHYLTADKVNANSTAANCPPAPSELSLYGIEPGCLWRAVQSVEVHLLLDSVDSIYDLTSADTAFRYSIDGPGIGTAPADPSADMGNGLKAGRMMRREFMALVATRNGNH